MSKVKKILSLILIIFVFAISISSQSSSESNNVDRFCAWAVYWDTENLKEKILKEKDLTAVSFFASFFDEKGNLFIPKELKKLNKSVETKRITKYLSFVNDKLSGKEAPLNKDTNVLYDVLSEDKVDEHISQIINLTKKDGYDGVEIDYENIVDDMVLWERFINFTDKLYERTNEEKLKLRIVLEPRTPFDKLDFIKGPEYVLMCYDMHYSLTPPGPKADDEFIIKMCEKLKSISLDNVSIALANGGNDWIKDNTAKGITLFQARDLINKHNANVKRDDDSYNIVFEYNDNAGYHEVWCVDEKTLKHQIELVKKQGDFGISIWRLS